MGEAMLSYFNHFQGRLKGKKIRKISEEEVAWVLSASVLTPIITVFLVIVLCVVAWEAGWLQQLR